MQTTDLINFAKEYAAAWCSQQPANVAAYFAENGSLSVNGNVPATGRLEIAKVAEGFMTAFPDLVVIMDRLITTAEGTEFHWTLTGTNSGPGGNGNEVQISGVELWQLDKDGLILESKGSFDTEEYNRQLQ